MTSHLYVGSGSFRSRSKGNSSPSQLVCYHNEIVPLRTVRYNGPTKGKWFYGCSYWRGELVGFSNGLIRLMTFVSCNTFFRRRKQQSLEHEVDMLNQEMELIRDKVKKLKAKIEKLFEEVEELGMATIETIFELKENNTNKRLMLTLLLSRAFFTLVLMLK